MKHIGISGFELEKENTRAGAARMLLELLSYIAKIPDIEKSMKITLYYRARIPAISILQHPVFHHKVLKIWRPSFSMYYNILLPRAAKKDNVDFVFFPTFMLPFWFRGRSIVVIHDTIFKEHPHWFPLTHRIAYRILIQRAARKASVIFTLTNHAKKSIVKHYGVEPKRIVVAYLGIDPHSEGGHMLDTKYILKKYGIDREYIFYTGQIFIRRHVRESMLAFEKIAPDFPNFQFLVSHRDISIPPQHIDLLAEQINHRLGRKAILRTAFVDDSDLMTLYREARLFVYASEHEGFGLPPAEATMTGTPALTGANGAAEEIFGKSGAFFVKNPSDPNEIAQVMKTALTDERMRSNVIAEGQKNLHSLTWERYARQIVDFWKTFS